MLSIYKASAGSGKTFTLTYRYIKLLLGSKGSDGKYRLAPHDHENHRHILAVTFTNKATEEMKSRIVHELAVLGDLEPGWNRPSPYLHMLMTDLDCSETELKAAAADSLVKLLFDFTFFQVSTIDSFFQTILRTFAHDLDLTGNYEVDLDTTKVIAAAVRELFDSLRSDPGSTESRRITMWIWQYLRGLFSQGKSTNIFNRSSATYREIVRLICSLSNEQFTLHHDAMMDYMRADKLPMLAQALTDAEKLTSEETAEKCRKALHAIESRGYDGASKLKVNNNLLNLLHAFLSEGTCNTTGKTLANACADIRAAYGAPLKKHLDANPDSELDSTLSEACTALRDGVPRMRLLTTMRSNLFVLGIMERVYFHIEQYHNDNNTMLLSDASGMLRTILTDGNVPFVFDRVGVWLDHFLIDEFQDTSRLQWDNLRPLLAEAQGSGHDSLIIGDEKQCIYRFRFSDPTLLQKQVLADFGSNARIEGDTPEGNTNWRSSADVVRFNNALFATLAAEAGFSGIYGNVNQKVSPKHASHRGYVQTNAIEAATVAGFESVAFDNMYREISRQIASGYRACDIVVLTRFNTEATRVISYLMDRMASDPALSHLRIISDDAMLVVSSPAVRIIISVMRYMALSETEPDGSDTGSYRRRHDLAAMINRYNYIAGHTDDPETALRQALGNTNTISSELEPDINDMTCYSVPSLVERIISRYISPALAREQNMFISAFQDVVLEYFSFGTGNLRSFLRWWDERGRLSTVSSAFDKDALRVMTIHKSKGLEFKCVHIPEADWDTIRFKGYEWFDTSMITDIDPALLPPLLPLKPDKSMTGTYFEGQYSARCAEQVLDELNVLYVAFTRAVDELIVSYSPTMTDALPAGALLDGALHSICTGENGTATQRVAHDGINVSTVTFGTPTTATEDSNEPPATLDPVEDMTMSAYYSLDREDLWAEIDMDRSEQRSEARERGIMLHDVLSHVRTPSMLHKAIMRQVRKGAIPKEESAAIETFLSRELGRPEVKPWFEDTRHVVMEREVVFPQSPSQRPDRVVWRSDGFTDVIDYKFGAEHHGKYSSQVRGYMKTLIERGESNVRGFLWYLDSGKIREVTLR